MRTLLIALCIKYTESNITNIKRDQTMFLFKFYYALFKIKEYFIFETFTNNFYYCNLAKCKTAILFYES